MIALLICIAVVKAITVSSTVTAFVVGTVLPWVHDAVTKANASPKLKVVVMLVLSAAGSVLTSAIQPDGTAILSAQTVLAFFVIVITSTGLYKRVYQAAGLSNQILPSKGIG